MRTKIIIAIDGHSSCGKSTLAKNLASRLEYIHVDSGAMYRAVTHWLLARQIDPSNDELVSREVAAVQLTLKTDPTGTVVCLDGIPLRKELRMPEVNAHVSHVAKISKVRQKLVAIQRAHGAKGGIVMDGRDIGSVVFPDAPLKIFLTASLEVRTTRRWEELLQNGVQITRDAVKENLQARDQIDSNRRDSPLIMTGDAVCLDNTNLSIEEQLAMVITLARLRGA
ncbi:MAG: (d)CMP kinase [Saprospiraceae bacterium]|nr:(d)CMP kinase [Saprospiraceae bacterium]